MPPIKLMPLFTRVLVSNNRLGCTMHMFMIGLTKMTLMITSAMIMVMIMIKADNDGVFDLECSPEDRLSV